MRTSRRVAVWKAENCFHFDPDLDRSCLLWTFDLQLDTLCFIIAIHIFLRLLMQSEGGHGTSHPSPILCYVR